MKNKIELIEEKEKKTNEALNLINLKEKSKNKESWKNDVRDNQDINLKNTNKLGIKVSRIPPFGSSSSARGRGSTSFRQHSLGQGQGQGQGFVSGFGMPFISSNIISENEDKIEIKGFNKDIVEADFLSATAHLSTSELRNR